MCIAHFRKHKNSTSLGESSARKSDERRSFYVSECSANSTRGKCNSNAGIKGTSSIDSFFNLLLDKLAHISEVFRGRMKNQAKDAPRVVNPDIDQMWQAYISTAPRGSNYNSSRGPSSQDIHVGEDFTARDAPVGLLFSEPYCHFIASLASLDESDEE